MKPVVPQRNSCPEIHAVTGAFGFTGSYIARLLLEKGHQVLTLTNDPSRPHPLSGRVWAVPYRFDDPGALRASLAGVSVLHNNYWVRFNHKDFSYASAIDNSIRLFEAARDAGVRRIVHVSISNPSHDSPFEYFSGKARLEDALGETGIPHSILRPALVYGVEDILVNNIAWFLRTFPMVGIFGDGNYRVQPICVDDLAALAIQEAFTEGNRRIDAVGPDDLTYREFVETLSAALGLRRRLVSLPPGIGLAVARIVGLLKRDVVLTSDEIQELTAGLLHTGAPPAGPTRFAVWATAHRNLLGRGYQSELARRRRCVQRVRVPATRTDSCRQPYFSVR